MARDLLRGRALIFMELLATILVSGSISME